MRKLTKTTCDLCGKTFDEYDKSNDFCIMDVPGYGSRYDGEKIHINLCCKCFDSIVDKAVFASKERDARYRKARNKHRTTISEALEPQYYHGRTVNFACDELFDNGNNKGENQ